MMEGRHRKIDIQTYRQAGSHADIQTDRQAGRQAGRQEGRQTDRQAARQAGREARTRRVLFFFVVGVGS